MDNCRCYIPSNQYLEFEIEDNNRHLNIYLDNEDSLKELKEKIICEFLFILQQLECGIQPDLEFLKQEQSIATTYPSIIGRKIKFNEGKYILYE